MDSELDMINEESITELDMVNYEIRPSKRVGKF